MTPAAPLVEITDVSHSYAGSPALSRMTWAAQSAQITCVLGPNGAGKTTVMEMAEGLRKPDQGRVRVLGQDPWGADAQHRSQVGVMLQDIGLPGSVKPLRLLHHVGALYGTPEGVEPLVERLDIRSFAGTSIRRLSGGQRQRVALAAALVANPQVAFLDEPSAGLDPHARRDVWQLIQEQRERGSAVVVTTHSFEEAARLADHVVVVASGRVVASGTVAEVSGARSLEDAYFALTRGERQS